MDPAAAVEYGIIDEVLISTQEDAAEAKDAGGAKKAGETKAEDNGQ